VTLGEWLEREWFGVNRVSTSAAAWTGLLDRRTMEWDAPLLATLGASPDQFAQLVDVSTPARGLRASYVRRWPALRDVPWFPAIGDGAAANIGSGCVGPHRVALTLGTTGALRVVLPEVAVMPGGLWCYRVDSARALLGGATSEGGNVYAWLSQTLRLGDADTVEAQLADQPPDGHGLTVLPFVAGERSPGWAGDVPATFHGLTLATTPIGILRAGLEAVAYRFALILKSLPLVNASQPLIASGGALQRSPAWAQIFADRGPRSSPTSWGAKWCSRRSPKRQAGAWPCWRSRRWGTRPNQPRPGAPLRRSTCTIGAMPRRSIASRCSTNA